MYVRQKNTSAWGFRIDRPHCSKPGTSRNALDPCLVPQRLLQCFWRQLSWNYSEDFVFAIISTILSKLGQVVHARTGPPPLLYRLLQRFNNGQGYSLRSRRSGEASPPPPPFPAADPYSHGFQSSTSCSNLSAPTPAVLMETDSHAVVRAGCVPAAVAAAASSAGGSCSGRVLSHG